MIRIIAGTWRGRRIATPPGEGTRPAANAHREAVLNALGPRLDGARVLDFFAGSGAFGLECVSRGADEAVLVERARAALAVVRRNVRDLDPPAGVVRVLAGDAYRLRPQGGPFDVIFVAPPYPHFRGERRAALLRLLGSLRDGPEPLLATDGIVVVQSESGDFTEAVRVPGLERTRDDKRFGRTTFTFLG